MCISFPSLTVQIYPLGQIRSAEWGETVRKRAGNSGVQIPNNRHLNQGLSQQKTIGICPKANAERNLLAVLDWQAATDTEAACSALLALDLVDGVLAKTRRVLLQALLQPLGNSTLGVDGSPVVEVTCLRALKPDIFGVLVLGHDALAS